MRTRFVHTVGLTLLLGFGCVSPVAGAESTHIAATYPSNAVNLVHQELTTARQRVSSTPTNSIAAWQLGQACFSWGKLLTNRTEQEKIYTEGVTACRRSIALDPKSAPGHYYLGMNIGRVADLKRNLAAFGMVKEVEKSFQRARELDEKFAHAGPDRNLGLLYQHAPGWPLSVGDKKLGRKHLARAVELAGDYPENRLNLAEAALEWKDPKLVQNELAALEKLWPSAKTNFTGAAWEFDWQDWEQRLKDLRRKASSK